MATITGKSGTVKDSTNAVGEVRSFEVDVQTETQDDTVMGDTWRTKIAMHNSWTATVECLYDPDDTNGQVAFTPGATIDFNGYADSDQSGGALLAGSAIVTGRRVMSSYEDLVTLSLTLEGNGAMTESVVV